MSESPRTRLASLFTSCAVLQAGRSCPVWGWDAPGARVTLRIGAHVDSVQADARGAFRFDLPAMRPGGPHRLQVEGTTTVVLEDVWFGEVWLASGQSNMEWRVNASRDAAREVAAGNWPLIRAFKVEPHASDTEQAQCNGRWIPCSPEEVGDFSAVAYFFAREVHWSRQVAVGIIDATWGGTCIEAWTSLTALSGVLADLDEQRARLRGQLLELPQLRAEYTRAVLEWQAVHLPQDTQNLGVEAGWAAPDFDDSGWRELEMPSFWQSHGMQHNGVVWFRRTLELPSAWAGHDLVLRLGALDDFDETYFDAAQVGRTPPGTLDAHRALRRYAIPAEAARGGRHTIAVRVFDHFGGGGFAGPRSEMLLECPARDERIPLHGPWRVRVEREIPLVPMSVFATFPPPPLALAQQNAPAALFNGMLAPLIPYALRGALWYQGESNVDRHPAYAALQLALMRDLRTRWGQGQFPFYYVQLAGYRAGTTWPLLREAQALVESEPETAMVVALDVGDEHDIHPTNKQEVGRRLSLLARARTYGEASVVCDGPRLQRALIEGSRVHLWLSSADDLGTSDGEAPRGFTLAGADGVHHPAQASVERGEIWLESPQVAAPRAVRYAFVDFERVNLQNGAGLPLAPFRTDPG